MLELSVSRLWRVGPEWLSAGVSPCLELELTAMPEACSTELRASSKLAHAPLTVESHTTIGVVINCEQFSILVKLMRVTSHVLRAVKRFQKLKSGGLIIPTTITPEERSVAEGLWITHARSKLTRQKDFESLRKQFNLFIDEKGLWRCGGRLANAESPYPTKHPVLLPRSHPLTSLRVCDAHNRVQHNVVKETLTEVRRRFWIVKGRSLTKTIIYRCVTCRRFEGAPYAAPPPPSLPVFRVKEDPAFTYTGVDFAGPIFIRVEGATKSNKEWICLFSCLVTRAIHLDIVSDLSTETFIRCLKIFASRRGMPQKFISDNGITFKAATQFVKTVFKEDAVQEHLAGQGSQWTFNIECAP